MTTTTASPTSRKVHFTRIFTAPRELVFRAWTDEKLLAQWWGPHGFTNPACEFEGRVGGKIHIDMRAPDGTVYPMAGEVTEFVEAEKLAFLNSPMIAGKPIFEILTTVAFAEHEGGTRMTVDAVLVSEETAECGQYLDGMQEGWKQSLERLDTQIVGTYAALPECVITHTFDATRDRVWAAYTNAEALKQWSGPKGVTMEVAELDFRPGGRYLYKMEFPGQEMWGAWTYRDIAAPERLVVSVSFTDSQGAPVRHPMAPTWPLRMLSVGTYVEHGGRTTLTMRIRPLDATKEEADTFAAGNEGMQQGFAGSMAKLDEFLANS